MMLKVPATGRYVNAFELDDLVKGALRHVGEDPDHIRERVEMWWHDDAGARTMARAEVQDAFLRAGLDPMMVQAWARLYQPIGQIQTLVTLVKRR